MLHVGGGHEAVRAATPGWDVVTPQVVPAGHPVLVLPATSAAGSEETQVRGGLGTMQPCTSTAVAIMVSAVPLSTAKLVWFVNWPFMVSCSATHCTGQVSKL